MNQVTMSSQWADENPNMDDMPAGSAHYKCVLRFQRRQMTVVFSQGPAVCRDPKAEDVLYCLLSDMSSLDCSTGFQDWASDMGYDLSFEDTYPGDESEKGLRAKRTYAAVQRQSDKLRNLLSSDALDGFRNADDPERFLKRLCKR